MDLSKKDSKKTLRRGKKGKNIAPKEKLQERINRFDDPKNAYISILVKKIKNTNKKIRQCDKIQKKVEEKLEVQKEELEILNNKEKMIYAVKEYNAILFKAKEVAFEEKGEITQKAKEEEKYEKNNQKEMEIRKEKREKEIWSQAKSESEDQKSKIIAEMEEKVKCSEDIGKQKAIEEAMKFYFTSISIDAPKNGEALYLDELNKVLLTVFPDSLPVDRKELVFFRNFFLMIFPAPKQLQSITSLKDELANSIRLIKSMTLMSEELVDGKTPNYSFKRMMQICDSISKSPSFYNSQQPPLYYDPIADQNNYWNNQFIGHQTFVPEINLKDTKETSKDTLEEAKTTETSETKTSKVDEIKTDQNPKKSTIRIPKKVPTSEGQKTSRPRSNTKLEKNGVKNGIKNGVKNGVKNGIKNPEKNAVEKNEGDKPEGNEGGTENRRRGMRRGRGTWRGRGEVREGERRRGRGRRGVRGGRRGVSRGRRGARRGEGSERKVQVEKTAVKPVEKVAI